MILKEHFGAVVGTGHGGQVWSCVVIIWVAFGCWISAVWEVRKVVKMVAFYLICKGCKNGTPSPPTHCLEDTACF